MVAEADISAIIACAVMVILVCVCSVYCLFVPDPTDLCHCTARRRSRQNTRTSMNSTSQESSRSGSLTWDSNPPSYSSSRFDNEFPASLHNIQVIVTDDDQKSDELPSYAEVERQPEKYQIVTSSI